MKFKKPNRIFEDTGNVDSVVAYHVMLENVVNTKNQDFKTLIDNGRYFSIFAPRQSGKTTFFNDFCKEIEKDSNYITIILNFQKYKNLSSLTFYQRIQKDLYYQLQNRLTVINCNQKEKVFQLINTHQITDHLTFFDFFEDLNHIINSKKIVIIIDEFDGIPSDELENFLTTLRDLYQKYKMEKEKALYSIGLVGIRNITKLIIGGVSPFNIADSIKLPSFTLRNIQNLYSQYTEETNQKFANNAIQKIYEETAGQPWLVNRLGTILTVVIKPETIEPITDEDAIEGIKYILKERNSHFDNLLEKAKLYKETFVQIVFNGVAYNPDDKDQSWLEQYGLIKEENDKAVVANNIYKKRFLKTFFNESGISTENIHKNYFTPDGYLNMKEILSDFEEYIIQIGVNAFYTRQKPYEKTGQFLLTALLYQFVEKGVGNLRYEPVSGLGRIDILLTFKDRKYIIETKVNRTKSGKAARNGIEQLTQKYLLTENVNEGYIVVFDITRPVGEFVEPEKHVSSGKEIYIFNIAIGK